MGWADLTPELRTRLPRRIWVNMMVPDDPTWVCPSCGRSLVRYYQRLPRRWFRKRFWRGCVSCTYQRLDEPIG